MAKCPPIPARSTLGDQASAHCRSAISLATPKAAALRMIAPTLPASWTPSRKTAAPSRFSSGSAISAAIPGGISASATAPKTLALTRTGAMRAWRTSVATSGLASAASVAMSATGLMPAASAAATRGGPSITTRRSVRRKRPSRTSLAQRLTWALSLDLIRRACCAAPCGLCAASRRRDRRAERRPGSRGHRHRCGADACGAGRTSPPLRTCR